ncbi:hypothetical protein BJ508DRAFT_314873 [Ascobolus immersus RN42]|uniref:Uncharacterized protein n=1 Tax=Ascobolus immersus RN42 TaxID=1160509 RepID=A0A3N4HDB8_ASCIM|nr:hypothetical protein BJ508DRAFT_314873 [Ascobolus immersus RN42]
MSLPSTYLIDEKMKLISILQANTQLSHSQIEDFVEQSNEILWEGNELWTDIDKVTALLLAFTHKSSDKPIVDPKEYTIRYNSVDSPEPTLPPLSRADTADWLDEDDLPLNSSNSQHNRVFTPPTNTDEDPDNRILQILLQQPLPTDAQICDALEGEDSRDCMDRLDRFKLDFLQHDTSYRWVVTRDGGASTDPSSDVKLRMDRKEFASIHIDEDYRLANMSTELISYLATIYSDKIDDFAAVEASLDHLERQRKLSSLTNNPRISPSPTSSPPHNINIADASSDPVDFRARSQETDVVMTEAYPVGTAHNPMVISSSPTANLRRFSLPPKPSVNLYHKSPKRRAVTPLTDLELSPTKKIKVELSPPSSPTPTKQRKFFSIRGYAARKAQKMKELGRPLTPRELEDLHYVDDKTLKTIQDTPAYIQSLPHERLDTIDNQIRTLIDDHARTRRRVSREIQQVRRYYNTLFYVAYEGIRTDTEFANFGVLAQNLISECRTAIEVIQADNPVNPAYFRLVNLIRDLRAEGLFE